jgi:hypothetical protein
MSRLLRDFTSLAGRKLAAVGRPLTLKELTSTRSSTKPLSFGETPLQRPYTEKDLRRFLNG